MDATYELTYFPVHARGDVSRILLAVSGAQFTDKFMPIPDWPAQRAAQRYGHLPALKVTTPDGNSTVLLSCTRMAVHSYPADPLGGTCYRAVRV